VTTLVHGEAETEHAKAAAAALFGGGALAELNPATLASALREAGSIAAAPGTPYVDLLVASGLVSSKGDARRTITEGGAYLNNERVTDPELVPGPGHLVAGNWLVLRRGKRNLAGVEIG
jgi:tyrosyl-tRNA synthetase